MEGEETIKNELTPEEADIYRAELEQQWETGLPESESANLSSRKTVVEEPEEAREIADDNSIKEPTSKESPPDAWTGVDSALRQTIENINARLSTLDAIDYRLKQTEARIGSITNEMNSAKLVAKETAQKTPTQEEIDQASKSEEAWKEFKEDFPEWAEAVEQKLFLQSETLRKEFGNQTALTEKIAQIESMVQNRVPDDSINRLKEEIKVLVKYPEYESEIQTEIFRNWILAQPDEIKQKTNSVRAEDAILVLDAFTKAKKEQENLNKIVTERKKRLAASPLPGGIKSMPSKRDEDLTDEEYRERYGAELWANS